MKSVLEETATSQSYRKAQGVKGHLRGACWPMKDMIKAGLVTEITAKQQNAAPLRLDVDEKKAEASDLCDPDLMPVNPVFTSKAGFKGNL